MILSQMRNYVRERGQVSLADIINHFDVDETAARQMLDVWINKGKIQRQMITTSCGSSCNQCESTRTEFYIWHEHLGLINPPADGCFNG